MQWMFWAAVGAAIGGLAGWLATACRLQTLAFAVLGLLGASLGGCMAAARSDDAGVMVFDPGLWAAVLGGAVTLIAPALLRQCRWDP